MTSILRSKIIGMASYLPEKILSNTDLEKIVDTSDEWIFTRTGMRERRIAKEDEYASDMGLAAAKLALQNAKKTAEDLDLIVVATMTPDYPTPSTAGLIQSALGAQKAASFDIQAACSGYLYGLSVAKAFVESGTYKNVLLVATEKLSSIINYEDRNTCVLFGDGATAALISSEGEGLEILDITLGSDGEQVDLLMVPAGGCRKPTSEDSLSSREHFLTMNGREVFKHAVRRMEEAGRQCIEKAQLNIEDIDWVVTHQANVRIMDTIAKRMGLSDDKFHKTIEKYGNTSAASVGIALEELYHQKGIEPDQKVLTLAFGAGFNWGAAVLKRTKDNR